MRSLPCIAYNKPYRVVVCSSSPLVCVFLLSVSLDVYLERSLRTLSSWRNCERFFMISSQRRGRLIFSFLSWVLGVCGCIIHHSSTPAAAAAAAVLHIIKCVCVWSVVLQLGFRSVESQQRHRNISFLKSCYNNTAVGIYCNYCRNLPTFDCCSGRILLPALAAAAV